MSSFAPPLEHDEVILNPGEFHAIDVDCLASMMFYDSTSDFLIQLNGNREIPMTRGKAIRIKPQDNVKTLTLKNNSSSQNTIKFYYGTIEIDDFALQITDPVGVQTRNVRPDASEQLFNGDVGTSTTAILPAMSDTEEIILNNLGGNTIEVINSFGQTIDLIAGGSKERYFLKDGINARSVTGTNRLVASRLFFDVFENVDGFDTIYFKESGVMSGFLPSPAPGAPGSIVIEKEFVKSSFSDFPPTIETYIWASRPANMGLVLYCDEVQVDSLGLSTSGSLSEKQKTMSIPAGTLRVRLELTLQEAGVADYSYFTEVKNG